MMPKPDAAHLRTEKELSALERRIAKLYREAGDELQETIDRYFEQFTKRDEEMKAMIGTTVNGKEWTEQDYKQWRLNQIGRGERYQALRDKLAQRMTDANAVAIAYTNDATPGIYSLNRNYTAYTIERVTGSVGFDLWDEQTVKRLMVQQPDLMPYYPKKRALKRGIDLAWGKKQITASVTSSILQGKSIKGMADDLQKRITTMNRDSAIRTARTAVTGAQNAGRQDAYGVAAEMGIQVRKRWMATKDGRTRHSHRRLDGEIVGTEETFSNGCRYPGDPRGKPEEIYNCRCTMRTVEMEGIEAEPRMMRVRDPATGRNVLVQEMTYPEWEQWKKNLQQQDGAGIIKDKIENGEISTNISRQQQNKHIPGTKQFEQYQASRIAKGKTPQSILTIDEKEAQDLIREFAGTGQIYVTKSGNYRNVEYMNADRIIGKYYKEGKYVDTTRFAVHYGKNGAHIVPTEERKND